MYLNGPSSSFITYGPILWENITLGTGVNQSVDTIPHVVINLINGQAKPLRLYRFSSFSKLSYLQALRPARGARACSPCCVTLLGRAGASPVLLNSTAPCLFIYIFISYVSLAPGWPRATGKRKAVSIT